MEGVEIMIQIGDSKDDELKGVNLLRIELGNLTLAIWKVLIYSRFEFYNGKYCLSISWKYFYFGFDKQVLIEMLKDLHNGLLANLLKI
jgi:hypothetical protein